MGQTDRLTVDERRLVGDSAELLEWPLGAWARWNRCSLCFRVSLDNSKSLMMDHRRFQRSRAGKSHPLLVIFKKPKVVWSAEAQGGKENHRKWFPSPDTM